MKSTYPARLQSCCALCLAFINLILVIACSPPEQRAKGIAGDYEDAKDVFKRGRFDRAIEFTDSMASASPPSSFAERARVLRAVIFSGEVIGFKELADAYTKGVESTKNPHYKAEYEHLRNDNLQYWSKRALGLGEVAQQLLGGGSIPKELTLDAPFPTAEGPVVVAQLNRVVEGGWIESDDQEAAAVDAQRKGIDDALAAAVGGDRAKARAALMAGPVKISGVDFALFLGKQLVNGATAFDRKHLRDPQKLRVLCGLADDSAKGSLALLKDNPDKDKEAEAKKLQDDVKRTVKNI